MKGELAEAEDAWLKKTHEEVMKEILQMVCVGIAAIQDNGLYTRGQKEISELLTLYKTKYSNE